MGSNFYNAGHLSLTASKKSYRIEIEIDGKKHVYYVSIKDAEEAKRNPKFVATIVGLVKEWERETVLETKKLVGAT
jgi:hypothetical protein